MSDTPTDAVTAAFDALIARLSEHALGENFERGVKFRSAVVSLRDRWAAGQMPRASTKRDAA